MSSCFSRTLIKDTILASLSYQCSKQERFAERYIVVFCVLLSQVFILRWHGDALRLHNFVMERMNNSIVFTWKTSSRCACGMNLFRLKHFRFIKRSNRSFSAAMASSSSLVRINLWRSSQKSAMLNHNIITILQVSLLSLPSILYP